MKTYQLFSFSGILLFFFWSLFEIPLIEKSTNTYHIEVASGNNESISFTADWSYIDKEGKKIDKKETLTTPYKITVETKSFNSALEKISGTGSMDITVKHENGELTSRFNKSLIKFYNGMMETGKAD